MRYLKALGLTLVAVFATGALAATSASANQFHSAATNTTVTVSANATQAYQYETGGLAIECTKFSGSGKLSSQTVSEITLQPAYTSCVAKVKGGSGTPEIAMNGCEYLYTIQAASNSGPFHVQCPVGNQIAITLRVLGISICTLRIPGQTPTGLDDYANSGATKVDVTPTQTGISATRQGSAECGAATSTSGSYTGQMQLKGEEAGNEKALQVG